jgi:hypothetical protein
MLLGNGICGHATTFGWMDMLGSNNAVALAVGDPEQPPASGDATAGEDDGLRWSPFSTDRF